MINGLGLVGTFGLFSCASLVGGGYFIVFIKSTQGLSSQQCKELYYPDDLKSNTNETELKEALLDEKFEYAKRQETTME